MNGGIGFTLTAGWQMEYGICFSLPRFGYIIHFDFTWIISEAQVRLDIYEMYINFIVLAVILIDINEVGTSLLPLWLFSPFQGVVSFHFASEEEHLPCILVSSA